MKRLLIIFVIILVIIMLLGTMGVFAASSSRYVDAVLALVRIGIVSWIVGYALWLKFHGQEHR